ncbi:MAG: hypothetical protein CME59_02310 [Halioglobus sp.]|nr:hypothetical protein [Halioglobus sp.]|tara:strand:- start:11942 stop:12163 length:222 start_codon:yes stop_codon:yes gene_type:complete
MVMFLLWILGASAVLVLVELLRAKEGMHIAGKKLVLLAVVWPAGLPVLAVVYWLPPAPEGHSGLEQGWHPDDR